MLAAQYPKVIKIVLVATTLVTALTMVSGCSYIKRSSIFVDRDTHYLSAKSIPPLKMPPGVSSNDFHSYYPVAEKDYPPATKNVTVIPPGL